MKAINSNVDIDKLIQLSDPSGKGVVVFFSLCQLISKHPDFKDYFKNAE